MNLWRKNEKKKEMISVKIDILLFMTWWSQQQTSPESQPPTSLDVIKILVTVNFCDVIILYNREEDIHIKTALQLGDSLVSLLQEGNSLRVTGHWLVSPHHHVDDVEANCHSDHWPQDVYDEWLHQHSCARLQLIILLIVPTSFLLCSPPGHLRAQLNTIWQSEHFDRPLPAEVEELRLHI